MTAPAAISAADGLYVAFSVVAFGAKLPVPEDDQVPPVAWFTVPPRPAVLWPAQIVWLPPVLAVAAGLMVTTIWAVTGPQGASWPVVVSVSVTVPAEMSGAEGV